ncbi:MAG: hypothetical protein ACJZ14_01505 [Candidatus Neomarinimicrobiota bacterium]
MGIDSAEAELSNKKMIWELFSNDWKLDNLDQLTHIVNLEELSSEIDKILSGNQNGRVVIKL